MTFKPAPVQSTDTPLLGWTLEGTAHTIEPQSGIREWTHSEVPIWRIMAYSIHTSEHVLAAAVGLGVTNLNH